MRSRVGELQLGARTAPYERPCGVRAPRPSVRGRTALGGCACRSWSHAYVWRHLL